MMPAPTNEMAIGMKMSDLGSDSRFIRSSSRASVRPSSVDRTGTMITQSTVLSSICRLSLVENTHV